MPQIEIPKHARTGYSPRPAPDPPQAISIKGVEPMAHDLWTPQTVKGKDCRTAYIAPISADHSFRREGVLRAQHHA